MWEERRLLSSCAHIRNLYIVSESERGTPMNNNKEHLHYLDVASLDHGYSKVFKSINQRSLKSTVGLKVNESENRRGA